MDNLTSRDTTLERMKSMAGCATCNNYNYVRCRACSWNDAMDIVEEMSTVDAIPVEWLQAKIKELRVMGEYQNDCADSICFVMRLWEKEQEER